MPRSLQLLDLFGPETAESPRSDSRPLEKIPQLWLAACLPNLAFESSPGTAAAGPAVVVEPQNGQLYVVAANSIARSAGIEAGNKLSTALALAASLQAFERTPRCERAALESLATWAQTLTSKVSLELPDGVLLEVSGSIKLFRSLEAIKAKLSQELGRRQLEFQLCVAPTATAALWLARAARADALPVHELTGHLAALPLQVTRWSLAAQALLRDMGVRTIGECVRLPRDGFARRVGVGYLRDLDRAHGRSFDLRAEFKAPETWSARVELFEESADCAVFVDAAEQLLDELAAVLRTRQAQIDQLRLAFEHLRRPPSVETFDLLEPTHQRERLLPLLQDRLERVVLPVPALALRMSSGFLLPLRLEKADLFEKTPVETLTQALFERLQERFGSAAVYGVRTVAEHRPERAWERWVEAAGAESRYGGYRSGQPGRPLWLLPEPLLLSSSAARNHYRGALAMCSGPERIESGWWDEQDVGRDYYTAVSAHGQRLWVFRDRQSRAWHLHGLFG
jgi:protein ImuB